VLCSVFVVMGKHSRHHLRFLKQRWSECWNCSMSGFPAENRITMDSTVEFWPLYNSFTIQKNVWESTSYLLLLTSTTIANRDPMKRTYWKCAITL
jgi:hypothetical protein